VSDSKYRSHDNHTCASPVLLFKCYTYISFVNYLSVPSPLTVKHILAECTDFKKYSQ